MAEANQYCLTCGKQLHSVRCTKKFCSPGCRATFHYRNCSKSKFSVLNPIVDSQEVQLLPAICQGPHVDQPIFAELTIIPDTHKSEPQTPHIEVVMNNGNRVLFYHTPCAEFIKHIVA